MCDVRGKILKLGAKVGLVEYCCPQVSLLIGKSCSDGWNRRLTTHKAVHHAQISQLFLGIEFAFQSLRRQIKNEKCEYSARHDLIAAKGPYCDN
jgi:hypothetical protein